VEPKIRIEDFTYNLPDEKIAKYPLPNRDDSQILIFRNKSISGSVFSNLTDLLPENAFMVFNNTKVVPARLFFRKESGAVIEIFCLEPYNPVEYNLSFASTAKCSWICVVGNNKRWKSGSLKYDASGHKELEGYDLTATKIGPYEDMFIIEFRWKNDITFSQLIETCGKVPIPPYLRRDSEESDTERYQTLYAKMRGSVAAPTAGLHFTEKLLSDIDKKGIKRSELSLHVGAGTFQPVKSEYISDHLMHSEPFSVTIDFLRDLRDRIGKNKVIAVGTTSARCLESLYYLGIQCIKYRKPENVAQWEPYEEREETGSKDSINALVLWLEKENMNVLTARTRIIIVPSYKFRITDILITNFHQPQSTLVLLIAAFIGEKWRDVYNYALNNNFRFLSYGDSSILFR
jgi:S-adenosylmethionine:tRNA ribosyltransferase-isomerase